VPAIHGRFLLSMIDKILRSLGVHLGLPPNTTVFKYGSLDVKSIRIINRVLQWCKKGIAQTEYGKENSISKSNSLNEQSPATSCVTGISSQAIINYIHLKLKEHIQVIEIIDSKGKHNNVEYINSDDLTKVLRENYVNLKIKDRNNGEIIKFKTRVFKELEFHENLQFFLCISPNKALDKIMIKKLTSVLIACLDNEYIKAVGAVKRPDPKDELEDEIAEVIDEGNQNEANAKKELDELDDSMCESIDLSDVDQKEQKKLNIQKKMMDRRKTRVKGKSGASI
jgi:hypothetical protein